MPGLESASTIIPTVVALPKSYRSPGRTRRSGARPYRERIVPHWFVEAPSDHTTRQRAAIVLGQPVDATKCRPVDRQRHKRHSKNPRRFVYVGAGTIRDWSRNPERSHDHYLAQSPKSVLRG